MKCHNVGMEEESPLPATTSTAFLCVYPAPPPALAAPRCCPKLLLLLSSLCVVCATPRNSFAYFIGCHLIICILLNLQGRQTATPTVGVLPLDRPLAGAAYAAFIFN